MTGKKIRDVFAKHGILSSGSCKILIRRSKDIKNFLKKKKQFEKESRKNVKMRFKTYESTKQM